MYIQCHTHHGMCKSWGGASSVTLPGWPVSEKPHHTPVTQSCLHDPRAMFPGPYCLFQIIFLKIAYLFGLFSFLTGLFVLKKTRCKSILPLKKCISWSELLLSIFEFAHDDFSHNKDFSQNLLSLYLSLQSLCFVACVKRPAATLHELKMLRKTNKQTTK